MTGSLYAERLPRGTGLCGGEERARQTPRPAAGSVNVLRTAVYLERITTPTATGTIVESWACLETVEMRQSIDEIDCNRHGVLAYISILGNGSG